MYSVVAAVNNTFVCALYDPESTATLISRSFLERNRDRFNPLVPAFSTRVFVNLPTGGVWCTIEVTVSASLQCDIILGEDWATCLRRQGLSVPLPQLRVACSTPVLPPILSSASASSTSFLPPNLHHSEEAVCDHSSSSTSSCNCSSARVSARDTLRANFFEQDTVHSENYSPSIFLASEPHVNHLLSLHGLPPCKGLQHGRSTLLCHLLHGECIPASSVEHSNRTSSPSACHFLQMNFHSATQLSLQILTDLCDPQLNRQLPTQSLLTIAACLNIHVSTQNTRKRHFVLKKLRLTLSNLQGGGNSTVYDANTVFSQFQRLSAPVLRAICEQHSIPFTPTETKPDLQTSLLQHTVSGDCHSSDNPGCSHFLSGCFPSSLDAEVSFHDWRVYVLQLIHDSTSKLALHTVHQILQLCDISFHYTQSLTALTKLLKAFVRRLRKGKADADRYRRNRDAKAQQQLHDMQRCHDEWPRPISTSLKDKLISMFRAETSSDNLASFTCASCAESKLHGDRLDVSTKNFDVTLLQVEETLQHPHPPHTTPPLPLANSPSFREFRNLLLDPAGICNHHADGSLTLSLCKTCASSLSSNKVPPFAMANRAFLGPVPDELKDLTIVEEAMIARSRAKSWIIHLREESTTVNLPNSQRAIKGHIIVYPQHPEVTAQLLPPQMEDIISPICIIFVGASPPTREWLRDKATPLAVRPAKVRRALEWLKAHNPLYADVVINESVLSSLDETHFPSFNIEHVLPNAATDTRTSRYDVPDVTPPSTTALSDDAPIAWQNVVITDVDPTAPPNELRAAAFRHAKEKGGAYIQVPHDKTPVNEFLDASLFPMIYPTLFPYGIGGIRDPLRQPSVSSEAYIKHLFNLADRRFQEHYSFLFTAFNMLQRHKILLHTKLRTQKASFEQLAHEFSDISPDTVHSVAERFTPGNSSTPSTWSHEESHVLKLMQQVSAVTTNVPGSSAARTAMRNEIRALMIEKGLPSFYITINPADVYNPIVKFLAGNSMNIDNLMSSDVPDYWQQSILIAKNPTIAARFFNIYMKAFISCLLRYDPQCKDSEGGVLGVVKAYYGCVEAQGRGTLHCHMLIWLEGGLNPDQLRLRVLQDEDFKSRLLNFLDDAISNSIPNDPDPNLKVPSSEKHPCSVRGIPLNIPPLDDTVMQQMRKKDMHHLVSQCQSHTHTKTCYKYYKGRLGEKKECRFDMDSNNYRPMSSVDPETGELCLRCLDGLVNNFNDTILEAMRCNMDIKFIGSGASAKAILYYITDYITKTDLKTHVAYAALELAVKKLAMYNPDITEFEQRARRMLSKCAYALISHQELSAQQVASSVMGFEDHFTSHKYTVLYWSSIESFINAQQPSPECSRRHKTKPSREPTVDEGAGTPSESNDEPSCDDDEAASEAESVDEERDTTDTSTIDEESDVQISFDGCGNMVAVVDLVDDYRFRGEEISTTSLWDFRSNIIKISKKSDYYARKEDGQGDGHTIICDDTQPHGLHAKIRPRIDLQIGHRQAATHHLYMLNPLNSKIPVPLGEAIPRRDRPEVYPRFCRLMLILFKPWREAADLRQQGQSWEVAYDHFLTTCSAEIRARIDNIQMLHECRDSRDDHFEKRRRDRQGPTSKPTFSNDFQVDDTAEEVLEHLQDIDACYSEKNAAASKDVLDCLYHANEAGVFGDNSLAGGTYNTASEILVTDTNLEDTWQSEYERRRDAWKKRATQAEPSPDTPSAVNVLPSVSSECLLPSLPTSTTLPIVTNDQAVSSQIVTLTPDAIADKWSLNTEQRRSFLIITQHSTLPAPPQLRMYLGGPGGSGKSRVIDAISDYFTSTGRRKKLRLAAFTGIAARHIRGVTLHSILSLSQLSKKCSHAKTIADLTALWDGVSYLLIDEVSMIGCNLLHRVSDALNLAKANSEPYGGINIIFAGDFAQLPPVGEPKLYSSLKVTAATRTSEKVMMGKLLWLSVETVTLLQEHMRQAGAENAVFVDLLSRLRRGACNQHDYDLLRKKVITSDSIDWQNAASDSMRIIVTQNAVKDVLNERGAHAFAQKVGCDLHWYYSEDRHKGQLVTEPALVEYLRKLPSNQAEQRLGRLPLVIGMPVIITHNFDVDNGIVNGTFGTVAQIRYTMNADKERYATSCLVRVQEPLPTSMPGIAADEVPVYAEVVHMNFRHPHSGKICTIQRRQLPVLPAFAMTAHKSQGQTLDKAIVDLQGCRSTEAAYVMLSRVRSLNDLHILRPFNIKRITTRPSEESRKEFKRLEIAALQTKIKYAFTEDERNALTAQLQHLNLPIVNASAIDFANVARAVRREQERIDVETALFNSEEEMPGSRFPRLRNKSHQTQYKRKRDEDTTSAFPRRSRRRIG